MLWNRILFDIEGMQSTTQLWSDLQSYLPSVKKNIPTWKNGNFPEYKVNIVRVVSFLYLLTKYQKNPLDVINKLSMKN